MKRARSYLWPTRLKESRRQHAGIAMLWERGWGKAPQAHTGENGEGDIRVTIRHIVQEISAQKVIDHD